MRASAVWDGGYRSVLVDGRHHSVVVDLPEDDGGDDTGPSALELNLLSLAGCITTIFALVARKRRLPVEHVRVDLEGKRPPRSPTLVSVEGTAHIVTVASMEDISAALEIALRTCPVGVLYERAGIPVHIHAIVGPPEPAPQAATSSSAHA